MWFIIIIRTELCTRCQGWDHKLELKQMETILFITHVCVCVSVKYFYGENFMNWYDLCCNVLYIDLRSCKYLSSERFTSRISASSNKLARRFPVVNQIKSLVFINNIHNASLHSAHDYQLYYILVGEERTMYHKTPCWGVSKWRNTEEHEQIVPSCQCDIREFVNINWTNVVSYQAPQDIWLNASLPYHYNRAQLGRGLDFFDWQLGRWTSWIFGNWLFNKYYHHHHF